MYEIINGFQRILMRNLISIYSIKKYKWVFSKKIFTTDKQLFTIPNLELVFNLE